MAHRQGTFPFFELPLLVREKIFQHLVKPFTRDEGAIQIAVLRGDPLYAEDSDDDIPADRSKLHPLRDSYSYRIIAFPARKAESHNRYTRQGKD